MKLEKTKEYYRMLIDLVESNSDVSKIDVSSIRSTRDKHLLQLELSEIYKIDIAFSNINNTEYLRINEFTILSTFGGKSNRTISWSDDGKQPDYERLVSVEFTTGAYIFGNHYPKPLFNEFFNELKAFGCKYSDTKNSALYFDLDTGSKVISEFYSILDKYHARNKEQVKISEIESLESRLKELKKN